MANEEKVLDYIKNYNNDPLIFSTEVELTQDLNSENLILECLKLTYNHGSLNNKNVRETSSARYRSSLDIWRHVKYYQPEITIFEVMRTLYKNREVLIGQYCNFVHRRVFMYKINNNWYSMLSDKYEQDEYGLTFYKWRNIGL